MADMKDSGIEWIGEIPTDWDTKAIRFLILEHFSGAWGNDEKTDSDNNRICMRIADFDYFRMQFKENVEYTIRNYTNTEIANKTLRYGDLLIEKSGGGEKTPVGRTVVYRLNNNALFANFMDCIRLKENEYNYEFAKYVFYSLYNNGITNLYYNKTTGIQNLSMQKYLREVKLPFPTLIEQGKIADFLDKKCAEVDTLHTDIEKQIETLEEYEKSIITEVVTKGLDSDVEMKDSGVEWIGMIPVKWNIGKIKSYVDKVGSGKTPKGDDKLYTDGDILFLRSQNIYDTGIVLDENPTVITDVIDKEMANTRVKVNDVLLNITGGSIGRCCIYNLENKANVNQHVSIIRTQKNKILPAYMHYFWISDLGQTAIKLYQTGGNREGMSAYAIKNTPIPIMSIQEQNEIINYLDKKCSDIDGAIADKKQQLETLEQYKKSLIYEYVTGKKEVPDNE